MLTVLGTLVSDLLLAWIGFHPSELFPTQMTLEHGAYAVPDGPGLGVEVDEAALRRALPHEKVEPPHLRRSDGSITNW